MNHIEILALSPRMAIKVLSSSVYSKGGKIRKKQGHHDAEKTSQTRQMIVRREKKRNDFAYPYHPTRVITDKHLCS